jgi:hypothetical protein
MVECIAKSSKGAGGERPSCSRDAFGSPRAAPTSRLQRPPETRQAPVPHSTTTSGTRQSCYSVVTLHGEVVFQGCLTSTLLLPFLHPPLPLGRLLLKHLTAWLCTNRRQ